jgi:hypothetical protein
MAALRAGMWGGRHRYGLWWETAFRLPAYAGRLRAGTGLSQSTGRPEAKRENEAARLNHRFHQLVPPLPSREGNAEEETRRLETTFIFEGVVKLEAG